MRSLKLQRTLQNRGMDATGARHAALAMIDGQLHQQAMVISFEKLFYLAGILFLLVLPLVFFLKMPEHADKIDVHVEM